MAFSCRILATLVFSFAIAAGYKQAFADGPVRVYFDNFDDAPQSTLGVAAAWSGYVNIESVQGFAGLGNGDNKVSGTFLHNPTGNNFTGEPSLHSILTLTNLPIHESLDLDFVGAIIDTWDGGSVEASCCQDIFFVTIDGVERFAETFSNFAPTGQSYSAPPSVTIARLARLGFEGFDDSLYDFGQDVTVFDRIPHASDSVTIEWWASGQNWNRPANESWAIENVEISLHGVPVPEPSSLTLMALSSAAVVARLVLLRR